jgi:hypothetical protein
MTVTSKLAPTAALRVGRIIRTALTVILSVSFVFVLRDLIKHIQVYQGISNGNVAPYELELIYHRSVLARSDLGRNLHYLTRSDANTS